MNIQIEELLIDYIDGKLDPSKKAMVDRYLAQHPDIAEDLGVFNEIRLIPDENLVYENKAGLKRVKERSLPFILKYAVAAGGAMLIGLAMWLSFDHNTNNPGSMAVLKPATTEKKMEAIGSTIVNGESKNNFVDATNDYNVQQILAKNAVSDSKSNSLATSNISKNIISPKFEAIEIISDLQNLTSAEQSQFVNEEIAFNPLKNLDFKEIYSMNDKWNPVVQYEQEIIFVYENQSNLNTKLRTFLPENLVYIESEVKRTIHQANITPITEKIKNAFQINKLKEALVPSSIQENLTAL